MTAAGFDVRIACGCGGPVEEAGYPLRVRQLRSLALFAWLPALLALAAPAAAQTGSLTVSWDPTGDPAIVAHRVYFGTDPANLTGVNEVPVPLTTHTLTGLVALATYFVEVTAVTGSGCESVPSGQVSAQASNPGPVCQSVSASGTPLQGRIGLGLTVTGLGFETGIGASFSQALVSVPITATSVSLVSSTRLNVTVNIASNTPTGPIAMTLANTDPSQPPATCSPAFSVVFDPGRADINDSGRVDGFDVASLGAVFGGFDRICTPDAPSFGARGDRCDDEVDCGGTIGVTSFCTPDQCAFGSPAAAGVACNAEADCGGTAGTSFCAPSLYNPAADLDGNGIVDGTDQSLLLARFGDSVP